MFLFLLGFIPGGAFYSCPPVSLCLAYILIEQTDDSGAGTQVEREELICGFTSQISDLSVFFLRGHIFVWLSCIYSNCLKIRDFLPEVRPLFLIRNTLCCFKSYEKLDCRTLKKTIPWTSDVAQVEHESLTLGSSTSKKRGEWGRWESKISEG